MFKEARYNSFIKALEDGIKEMQRAEAKIKELIEEGYDHDSKEVQFYKDLYYYNNARMNDYAEEISKLEKEVL